MRWWLGLTSLALASCSHEYQLPEPHPAAIQQAPPEPQAESIPVRPFYGAVWQAGSWDYNPSDHHFFWLPGHWANPPSTTVVWVPPHWVHRPYGWVREPARWAAGRPYDQYGRHVWYDTGGRKHYL
jgi:hypothetical protein